MQQQFFPYVFKNYFWCLDSENDGDWRWYNVSFIAEPKNLKIDFQNSSSFEQLQNLCDREPSSMGQQSSTSGLICASFTFNQCY